VIAGGDGTGNVAAPAGDERGWSYVGRLSNVPSSVTFLGNQWFITANHIKVLDKPTSVLLNDQTYSIDPSKWTRITNSVGTDADLMMFRVDENVGLANLTVRSSSSTAGTAVTMIGNGFDRYPDLIPLTLGPSPNDYELLYQLKSGTENTSKRWGLNTVNGAYYNNSGFVDTGGYLDDGETFDPDLYGSTQAFYTDFSPYVGEAQAVTYDSGGGVFVGSGDSLELAGIMVAAGYTGYSIGGTNAVMLTEGSPGYNGSETYIADLSAYSNQINQTIPEPSTAILLAGIAALFGVAHRVRCMFE
jgi:hypothetical protein